MIFRLARYSAIACALLTLACVATWLLEGAPNFSTLPKEWDTVAGFLALKLHSSLPWFTRSALFVVTVSVTFAAALSLLTLLRGSDVAYMRHLGTGLGWWSLGFSLLLLVPAIPVVTSLPLPLAALGAMDVLAFNLMLGATFALLRFWSSYPREITLEELHASNVAKVRKDYQALPLWRRRLYDLVLLGRGAEFQKSRIAEFTRMNRKALEYTFQPGLVARAALLLVATAGGLMWRFGPWYFKGSLADVQFEAALLILMALVMLPGVHSMSILRLHRTRGTAGERRKIEWIWASFWIAIVMLLFTDALAGLVLLDITIFDAYGLDPTLVSTLLSFVLMTPLFAPLCVLVALSLSIFYRGDVDPKLALRGVTLWALVGMLLTLVFALVERSVAIKLGALLGLPPQTSYVAAGAVVAATFQPIRKHAEKQVNRFVARVLPGSELQAEPKRPARQPRKKTARLRRRSVS